MQEKLECVIDKHMLELGKLCHWNCLHRCSDLSVQALAKYHYLPLHLKSYGGGHSGLWKAVDNIPR